MGQANASSATARRETRKRGHGSLRPVNSTAARAIALAAVLLTGRKLPWPRFRVSRRAVALLAFACPIAASAAQIPPRRTLDKLRRRLLAVPEATPPPAADPRRH